MSKIAESEHGSAPAEPEAVREAAAGPALGLDSLPDLRTLTPQQILGLQRAVGNAAVARLARSTARPARRLLQRQEQKTAAPKVRFTVKVPAGLSSGKEFLRYSETVIFGKVVNFSWHAAGKGSAAVLEDPSKHVGEIVSFDVDASDIAGNGNGQATAEVKAQGEKDYQGLGGGERDEVDAEIDRRYFDSTGETPGTKIKKGETGKIAIWNSFKAQVLADKRKLDALPDAVKQFIGTSNFTPDQYRALVGLADKIGTMSAAELADYKAKVTRTTTSLAELEAAIDAYLAAKAEREKAREARETIVTKLFGAEDLYETYKHLGEASAELEKKARDKDVQGAGHEAGQLRLQASALRQKELGDFTARLKEFGFDSIAEFQKTLDAYEQAFLTETTAIAFDLLQRYEHTLWEAENHYANPAAVDSLLSAVQSSGAPELLAQASQKMSEASKLHEQASFQTVQGNAGEGNKLANQSGRLMNEAKDLTDKASKAVRTLPNQPLVAEEKFPRAELLGNDRAKATAAIKGFIADRRKDIEKSRGYLRDDPKMVYKLPPKLLSMSYEQQGITPGSIFDKVISERRAAYVGNEALLKIVLAVIGIALTLLVPVGGAVAALAALGALGISGYQAIEEYKEYEQKSAFAGVGLADDPSFGWVIVAVVGAAADLGQAVVAVRALKAAGAVEALAKTGNVVEFEKSLQGVKELTAAERASLLAAGEARAQAWAALREIVSPTKGGLNAMLFPLQRELGQLAIAAFYAAKSGIYTFKAWLAELKGAGLIKDASLLKPNELKALKAAWEEGRAYTKSIKSNIPKLEGAIKEFRAETGISRGVTAEGKVQGGTSAAAKAEVEGVDKSIFTEGSTRSKGSRAATVRNNPRYASPQKFGGTKNHAEQNVLGDIADEIDQVKGFKPAMKGKPKPGVNGKIHIHVEQEVCSSCRQGLNNPEVLPGVVQQFSAEFPNVTLVITNPRTSEVLFVRGGKVISL